MIIGVTQVYSCPPVLASTTRLIWILTVIIGIALGALDRRLSTVSLVAYLGIPAFIVTLGGRCSGAARAWWVTAGQTIAPLDDRFALMGGGPHGSIGATASWIIAASAAQASCSVLFRPAAARALPVSPAADLGRICHRVVGCFVVARRNGDRQCLSLARAGRRGLCRGATTFLFPKAACHLARATRFRC